MERQKFIGKELKKRLKKARQKKQSIAYVKYILKGSGQSCPLRGHTGKFLKYHQSKPVWCIACHMRID